LLQAGFTTGLLIKSVLKKLQIWREKRGKGKRKEAGRSKKIEGGLCRSLDANEYSPSKGGGKGISQP